MNAVALAIVVAAGVGDLVFVQALKPTSLGAALLLAAWLLTPCIVSAAWLARVRASRAHSAAAGIVTTVVAAGGASWLIRTIYIRPDAQGPIAVVLTPIYQMAALAVGAPVSAWLAARRWRRR
jgi:hypothetical protein